MWRTMIGGMLVTVATAMPGSAQTRTFDPIVYRAAVPAMLGGTAPDTIVVGPRTVRLSLPESVVMRGGDWTERLAQFDAIPAGLPEALDALTITPRDVATLGLPPGFRVLDDSSAALLWTGDWRALRRRVHVPRGVLHLTPVAYAPDGRTALVGMLWDCGPDCRRTIVAWLVPDGTGGWTVAGTHEFPRQ